MPLLSLQEFFGLVSAVDVTADISSNTARDEAGSGSLNRASYGTRLWSGSVRLSPLSNSDADNVQAKIEYIKEADVVFRVSLLWRSAVDIATGTVDAVGTDRRQVQLSQTLVEGEVFGITYGARRSMHRVVSSDGASHVVVPAVPFGVNTGDAIAIGNPEIDAVWDGSRAPRYGPKNADQISFDWIQNV